MTIPKGPDEHLIRTSFGRVLRVPDRARERERGYVPRSLRDGNRCGRLAWRAGVGYGRCRKVAGLRWLP